MRTTISGAGWQISVPSGWIAVDGGTAEMVRRDLDDGDGGEVEEVEDDGAPGPELGLVMVREADRSDRIMVMAMAIDEEWMDEAAVKEIGEELASTVKRHFRAAVSPLHAFKVAGEPATAFDYFVEHKSGRIANRQGFFVADGVAYHLILASGSGDSGTRACLAAYNEIVREWKWAPAAEAAKTDRTQ